ncbi:hypothetical protein EVAR_9212_1 [Eumeta japonica]|uniref:FLYWCH-type domain-containing protein n=1 Tax=Eumeta variegata TaxID=151549 RepID=A0A4C1WN61_EUMVA|nr:hypothetical protein EVAR_9212_1 [Eumeta japonica]
MLNRYTYLPSYTSVRKGSSRCRCTIDTCKAAIFINQDGVFLKSVYEHNHAPPKYHRLADGKYLKLGPAAVAEFSSDSVFVFSAFLVKRPRGTGLIYLGYMYYRHFPVRDGFRWRCAKFHASPVPCKAYLHADRNNVVVRAMPVHTHPYPMFRVTTDGQYLTEIITLTNGKKLLMLEGFSFKVDAVRGAGRWGCTAGQKCEAYVKTDVKLNIVEARNVHLHKKPSYHLTQEGKYLKIFG